MASPEDESKPVAAASDEFHQGFLYDPLPDNPQAAPPHTDFAPGRYTLPGHDRRLVLQTLHAHPRDARIRFVEAPHLYLIKHVDRPGEHQVYVSVTGVAGAGAAPFDAVAIIAKMRDPHACAERWPRSGYVVDERAVPPEAMRDGTGTLANNRGIMEMGRRFGKRFTWASMDAKAVRAAGLAGATLTQLREALSTRRARVQLAEPLEYATFERPLTPDEIQEEWRRNSKDASDRGTEGHFQAEQFMNGLSMHPSPELGVCLDFCRRHVLPTGARPYRTEWEIFTDLAPQGGEAIAGSVDLVVRYPDGQLGIIDWKRSPKLLEHMWDHFGHTRDAPLDHLDDCDGVKYALQLNIYAYILEKYYGFQVASLTLCSIHPDAPYATDVPRLPLETAYLMALHRRRAAAHHALAQQPELLCDLSGELRTHPMHDPATGRSVQHGALYAVDRAADVEVDPSAFVPDEPARRALELQVMRTATPAADAELERCAEALAAGRVPWRALMPKPGLVDCMRCPVTRMPVGQIPQRKRPRDGQDVDE